MDDRHQQPEPGDDGWIDSSVRIAGSLASLDGRLISAVLRRELARRQSQDRTYSLRAFAREMDLDPGDLSKVLRGLKELSVTTVIRIATRLELSEDEARVLVAAAALQRRKSILATPERDPVAVS